MEFESSADAAHDTFMQARGIDAAEELRRHAAHMKQSLARDLLPHERKDLKKMLSQRGVAPVPKSVEDSAAKRLGRSDKPTLAQIVTAFRGTHSTMGKEGLSKNTSKPNRKQKSGKQEKPSEFGSEK